MDLISLIHALGYTGIWATIFTETGLLFGILLPGDTLLFAAGVLAKQGYFNIWLMSGGCFIVALLGNCLGYWLGARYGLPFAQKYASKFVTNDHLQKTQRLFDKYGCAGIIIARFLPVARTVAPFLAGIAGMNKTQFFNYSFWGALIWGAGLPWLGYGVGHLVPPDKLHYLLFPVLAIILVILLAPLFQKKPEK
jgi:membrane-associated protein